MNTITPRCIVALTDEKGNFRHSVDAAIDLARSSDARLILYDSNAASSFSEPISSFWSADGVGDDLGFVLDEGELHKYGRAEIAEQVQQARDEGVEAYGWLPSEHGMDAFMEYASQVRADTAVVPESLDEPGVLDRLRGDTLDKALESATVSILIAEVDGTLHPAPGSDLEAVVPPLADEVDQAASESFPASDPPAH